MQSFVTFDWSRSIANELASATASKVNSSTESSISKLYLEHVQQLFIYGMNACDDRIVVKNCIVQCFLAVSASREPTNDGSFAVNILKVFRQLLSERTSSSLFPAKTDRARDMTSLQQEALFLKFQRKLTYREVAEIMDLPIEQLRGHISKALAILLREK